MDKTDKIVIDLNNTQLDERFTFNTNFAVGVENMLMDLYNIGFDVPTSVKGTQEQIDKFFRALKNEKRYMDSYMKYGLGDTRTMMSKRDLDSAVRGFEGETGLRWPFKN